MRLPMRLREVSRQAERFAMSRRIVEVTTGSRLHFGMMSFGRPGVRQFGGVGAMIDAPSVRLRISAADEWRVTGPSADVARGYAETVAQAPWIAEPVQCHIEILSASVPHVGLGSGTQLALAVAAGLNAFYERPPLDAEQLARSVGRGRRSAVGLYGFIQGGLILEGGKLSADEVSPLLSRVPLPDEWRFLLVRQNDAQGLFGADERGAFARLPPVPEQITAAMYEEASTRLLPAAAEKRFDVFSESLFKFGQDAGRLFASLQGGTYASQMAAMLVRTLHELGVVGVAQSSWGPTVFAVLPSEAAAADALAELAASPVARDCYCHLARPLNAGATIEIREDEGRISAAI